MRLVVIVAVMTASIPARADLCDGDPTRIDSYAPAGCPWHVFVSSDRGPVSTTFNLYRGAMVQLATTEITVTRESRRIFEQVLDRDTCERHWEHTTHDVDHYAITITDAIPGDRVSGELGDFMIGGPSECPSSRSYEPFNCWPDEAQLREAGCAGAPTRSPRCVDESREYVEPVFDRGVGARCPIQLVASALVAGAVTFELWRPPATAGAFARIEAIRIEEPELASTPRTEVSCASSQSVPVERLVYAVQFVDPRPNDLVIARDDEANLARAYLTGAETCGNPFRDEWCWVEESCPGDVVEQRGTGGCSSSRDGGWLLVVLLSLAGLANRPRSER